jgi:peptide/nickel transport system substrate-binding protein
MTVKLRPGIFWSDGKEFTADDVVFTTETHLKTNGLVRSAQFQLNVASIEAPDPHTVVFKLKKPNSRFHALFTVRWNAAWIMPKHIFEGKDPLKFDFNPPVSIGAYKLHGYDPNGQWFTWEKREDWQRTTLARFGEPGPRYVTYVDPGPPDRRVIAQKNHELDVIHDVSPEGMLTLAKDSPSSIAWFEGFPYAHPDPTLPQVILNHQNPKRSFRDPGCWFKQPWPPPVGRGGLCRGGGRCARTGRSTGTAAASPARCRGAAGARSAAATRSPPSC